MTYTAINLDFRQPILLVDREGIRKWPKKKYNNCIRVVQRGIHSTITTNYHYYNNNANHVW